MTTEKLQSNTPEPTPNLPIPVIASKPVKQWPLWLALALLAALCLMASVFGWLKIKELAFYDQRIGQLESNNTNQLDSVHASERRVTALISKLESAQTQVQQRNQNQDKQIAYNSRQLALVGGSSRTDWLLAEAEYLLRLANQRLNMERDFKGAEAILQTADSVLAETDDQGLYEVRKQLATEILSLQAISQIDYEGIYLQLEALINLTEKLNQTAFIPTGSLPSPELDSDAAPTNEGWQAQWQQVKKEVGDVLGQLIIIRRMDEPVAPLLAPDQVYYLQQNLRLMLEQAELALLDRDQAIYQRSLKKAMNWVDTYLVSASPDKQLIINNLDQLSGHAINPTLPDISGSLKLLKNRVEQWYRQHKTLDETQTKAEG